MSGLVYLLFYLLFSGHACHSGGFSYQAMVANWKRIGKVLSRSFIRETEVFL